MQITEWYNKYKVYFYTVYNSVQNIHKIHHYRQYRQVHVRQSGKSPRFKSNIAANASSKKVKTTQQTFSTTFDLWPTHLHQITGREVLPSSLIISTAVHRKKTSKSNVVTENQHKIKQHRETVEAVKITIHLWLHVFVLFLSKLSNSKIFSRLYSFNKTRYIWVQMGVLKLSR